MAGEHDDFDELLKRVRAGDQDAARLLYERYSDLIRRAVRYRLHSRLRRQFDSLDFVQSVWASFIRIPADRCTFETQEDLVGYLARMAQNKVVDVYRRREASRRDVCREVSLDAAYAEEPLAAPGPRPSQQCLADDLWERLLAGQEPQDRQILELRRQGHTYEEIGDLMRLNPKYVRRLVQKLAWRLYR